MDKIENEKQTDRAVAIIGAAFSSDFDVFAEDLMAAVPDLVK
jgi:hypothetical protein